MTPVPHPLVAVVLLALLGAALGATTKAPTTTTTPSPDLKLDTSQLVARRNYPVETHTVTTGDGYVLTVHRIPNPGKPVVLMMHGTQGTSADYVLTGPDTALGYLAYDAGYDVWLGNARGSKYSRNHTTMKNTEFKYWQFSWHEMGVSDLPATIDYVLANTTQPKLTYVGYSIGCSMLWVMLSQKPEYNDKISQVQAMAPIAFEGSKTNNFPKLNWFFTSSQFKKNEKVWGEYLPDASLVKLAASGCKDTTKVGACNNIFYINTIQGSKNINMSMLPVILSHSPGGSSIKTLQHFWQIIQTSTFRQYDFGKVNNTAKYGAATPPDYDLSKVTVPVYLHYADKDLQAEPKNVVKLCSLIKNCKEKRRVAQPDYQHSDFLIAYNARTYLFDYIISVIKQQ